MKRKFIEQLIVFVFIATMISNFNHAYAAGLDVPNLTLTIVGHIVQVSWNAVDGATGYTLFYAPYPEATSIGSLDIGNILRISGELAPGSAFYLAIKAYNPEGQSAFSNIEHFELPAEGINAQTHTIYVSPDGADNNDGSAGLPLKTFEGARNKVRTMLDGAVDITVYFREGAYVFSQTAVLDTQDGGSPGQTVTYAAYPGEKPVFTSLKQVIGWSRFNGNIMQADLPAGISRVRYLHDESETWIKRSSTSFFRPDITAPCGGAECEHWEPDAQVRKTYTIYPSSFSMPDSSKGPQYDLRSHMTAWNAQVLPISGIDPDARGINVATPSHYSIVDGIDDL